MGAGWRAGSFGGVCSAPLNCQETQCGRLTDDRGVHRLGFSWFGRRSRRDVPRSSWDGSRGLPRALGGAAAAATFGCERDFRRLVSRCWEGYGRLLDWWIGTGSRAIHAVLRAARGQALGGSWCFAAPIRLRPDFEGCWRAGALLQTARARPTGRPNNRLELSFWAAARRHRSSPALTRSLHLAHVSASAAVQAIPARARRVSSI